MYYVGIDVAKEKHYVCILDDTKEIAVKPFWVYTDILGIRNLLAKLAELSSNNDNFIIGIESTGTFSENIYKYLTDANYKVVLLNSYQTTKYRDFSTIKKIKKETTLMMKRLNYLLSFPNLPSTVVVLMNQEL